MTSKSKLIDANAVRAMLLCMHRIRQFEEAAGQALKDGHVRGSVHQYSGEEAIASGICHHLLAQDFVSSYHRGHGHAIAKGVSPARMMCELFGRAGGTSGGKGGSMHIADFSQGMLGANGVVPDGVTIAVGAAHAIKMQKRPEIVVAFFGDGAMNRGPLFEAFNWAKLFDLPVLFVCEDNGYSVTLKTKDFTAGPPFIERAKSFGIPTHSINGNDVVTVANTAGPLVEAIRQGSGPQFLHATTYRWYGHLAHDKGLYRDPAEVLAAREDDCIRHAETWLLEHGADAPELASLAKQANEEIQRAVKDALVAPLPDASSAWQDVQDIGSPSWA